MNRGNRGEEWEFGRTGGMRWENKDQKVKVLRGLVESGGKFMHNANCYLA